MYCIEVWECSAPTHPASSIISFSVVRESSPSFGKANPFFLLQQGPGVLVLVAAAPRGVCFPRPLAADDVVAVDDGPPSPPRLCLASWARCGEKEKWAAISVSPFLKGRRVGWAVNFLRPFYPSSAPFSSSCSFFPLPFPLYLRVPSSSSTLSSLRRNKAKKRIGDDDVAKSCPCVTPQREWLSKEIIV